MFMSPTPPCVTPHDGVVKEVVNENKQQPKSEIKSL